MPRKSVKKRITSLGEDLIEGMKIVLAHERGEVELEQVWPRPVDLKAIRKRVKMSQTEFAHAYHISKRAL
jgi:DNA-binding transcriptional regulator YiaG